MHARRYLSRFAQLYRHAAASSRPHARCGSVVRPRNNSGTRRACAGVLCVCDLRVQTHCGQKTKREGRRHGREYSAEKEKTAHSSTCNARVKSQPSLSSNTPFYSLSQRRRKKEKASSSSCTTSTRVGGDRGCKRRASPADTQSASAGSLSLHDTFCSHFLFARLCLTQSL